MPNNKKTIINNLKEMFEYYSKDITTIPNFSEYTTREEEVCLRLSASIDNIETSKLKIKKPEFMSSIPNVWRDLSETTLKEFKRVKETKSRPTYFQISKNIHKKAYLARSRDIKVAVQYMNKVSDTCK